MRDETAITGAEQPAIDRFRLTGVLVTVGLLAFTTALLGFSEGHTPFLLLYLLPVVAGALAYGVAGAVAATLMGALASTMVLPADTLRASGVELVTGAVVFLACGVVVGVQAQRQRAHSRALERASPLDRVTHVLKAEAFTARMAEEIARAERYQAPLGVVVVRVVDLEGFTRVFGQYKTGLMLAHLAQVLGLAVRSSDTIGRLTEADFGIVLPHADARSTRAVAERVRSLVGSASFEGDALEPVTTCATSAGWAHWPDDAADAEGLLRAALERAGDAPFPDVHEVTTCDA